MAFFGRFAACFADCRGVEDLEKPRRRRQEAIRFIAVAGAFTVAAVVAFAPTGGTTEPDAPSKIAWKIADGGEQVFRLSYENSQRLELLDFEKKPLREPDVAVDRFLDVDLRILWTAARRDYAIGTLRIERIRGARLTGWKGEPDEPHRLEATLQLRRDKTLAVQKLDWSRPGIVALADYIPDAELARGFHELLSEALDELCHYFPPLDRQVATRRPRSWTTWEVERTYPLERRNELHASMKLELLEEKSPVAKLAVIEGSISQQIPDAPPELQKDPGLFPGRISWQHDLQKGFPRYLEAEKIARIPVPDEQLPIIRTLTHTYRLRVGDPEAFPKEEKAGE